MDDDPPQPLPLGQYNFLPVVLSSKALTPTAVFSPAVFAPKAL